MKKKLLLGFLSLFCLVSVFYGQRFQVTTGTASQEEKWALVEDPAINQYVTIGNSNATGISEMWISSYLANGTVASSAIVTHGRNMIARDISIAPIDATYGNTYYVTGWTDVFGINQMFVSRIALNGAVLWYEINPVFADADQMEGVALVTEPVTNDVVALGIANWTGTPGGAQVILSRFNAGGGLVWSNIYVEKGEWMPREIATGPGTIAGAPNSFVITGEVVKNPGMAPVTFGAMYNGVGAEMWRNLYPAVPGIPTFGDAGYDVVYEPRTRNYCMVGAVQTNAVRAGPGSTPYILNVTPAGALITSSTYLSPFGIALGLYPRCVALGGNPGEVIFAGPNYINNHTFFGSIPTIAPPGPGLFAEYNGNATANSVPQPFILNDAQPEDVLFTNMGTAPGNLISTNAIPGSTMPGLGNGDGHFIRTDIAGATPDGCREKLIPHIVRESVKISPQPHLQIVLPDWPVVDVNNNLYPVVQDFCKDTCIVSGSYTYTQTGATVTFTGTGSGSGTVSLSWIFGDGNFGSGSPVTYTYSTSGTYNACLVVTNVTSSGDTCRDTICKPITINLCNINADFNYSVNCKTVTFTNTSTGTGPFTYNWNFGDATTSTLASPVKTYTSCGNYTVTLIVCGPGCCDTIVKSVVVPCCTVASDFCVTTYGKVATLNINTAINLPVTTYQVYVNNVLTPWANNTNRTLTAGSNTICVRAKRVACGDTCCATSCKTVFVADTCNLVANFWFQVRNNGQVLFTNQSTPTTGLTYSWLFGSGTSSSTLASPTFTYPGPGSYTACLTIRRISGMDTCEQKVCKTIVIDTPCQVQAKFKAKHCVSTPLTVSFTNMSTGSGPFTYEWNFGDGGTSSSANPSYTYAAAGTYIVCLKTLVNSNCWSRSCHKLIVSTLSANSSCTALPDTPAYRLAPLFIEENKMELVAEESSQNNVLMARQPKDGAEPLLAGKLNLFPNPASQVVQAVFVAAVNTTAEVMVMNASGKLVYKKVIPAVNGKNQLAIPVQKLPNGIYLVRIKTGDQALSGNFFVDNR